MVKELSIDLTKEQMQVVRKVVDAKCSTLVVPVDKGRIYPLYGIITTRPISTQKVARIHLTDAQKKLVRKVAGVECNFIDLDPTDPRSPIKPLYGIIAPRDPK